MGVCSAAANVLIGVHRLKFKLIKDRRVCYQVIPGVWTSATVGQIYTTLTLKINFSPCRPHLSAQASFV